jgi:hypothetical protein
MENEYRRSVIYEFEPESGNLQFVSASYDGFFWYDLFGSTDFSL